MTDLTKFYFGRLNLIASYDMSTKRSLFMKGFKSDRQLVTHKKLIWDFLDIDESFSNDEVFIYGYLVKYRPTTEDEVAQPEIGKIVDVEISNLIIGKSIFFLQVETGLIAFHPDGSQIDIEQFCRQFAGVFENAFDNFFVSVEIEIVHDKYELLQIIKEFEKLTKVEIHLYPSNPNISDVWEDVDKDLKQKQTAKYTEIYEAQGRFQELKIADDKETRSKIAMAEDGYGEAKLTGVLKGENKTISTRDNPVSASVETTDKKPQDILNNLKPAFHKILERFKDNGHEKPH